MTGLLELFDLYDKSSEEEMRAHTKSGSILTTLIIVISFILFLAELYTFIAPDIIRDLSVDPTLSNGQEHVNISLSVLVYMPCYFLHLDTMDSLGNQEFYLNSTVTFRRVNKIGGIIGIANESIRDKCYPCYNLSDQECCDSCEQLMLLAMTQGIKPEINKWEQCQKIQNPDVSLDEKCLIKGKLSMNKVSGRFHIAPGKNVNGQAFLHNLPSVNGRLLSMQHKIERIRFGPHIPRTSNPLSNIRKLSSYDFPMTFIYNCLVTPVKFMKNNEEIRRGFEYTVLSVNYLGGPPGLHFIYSFTPYTIVVTLNRKSAFQFISSTFGVVSGMFAIATIIESFVQTSEEGRAK